MRLSISFIPYTKRWNNHPMPFVYTPISPAKDTWEKLTTRERGDYLRNYFSRTKNEAPYIGLMTEMLQETSRVLYHLLAGNDSETESQKFQIKRTGAFISQSSNVGNLKYETVRNQLIKIRHTYPYKMGVVNTVVADDATPGAINLAREGNAELHSYDSPKTKRNPISNFIISLAEFATSFSSSIWNTLWSRQSDREPNDLSSLIAPVTEATETETEDGSFITQLEAGEDIEYLSPVRRRQLDLTELDRLGRIHYLIGYYYRPKDKGSLHQLGRAIDISRMYIPRYNIASTTDDSQTDIEYSMYDTYALAVTSSLDERGKPISFPLNTNKNTIPTHAPKPFGCDDKGDVTLSSGEFYSDRVFFDKRVQELLKTSDTPILTLNDMWSILCTAAMILVETGVVEEFIIGPGAHYESGNLVLSDVERGKKRKVFDHIGDLIQQKAHRDHIHIGFKALPTDLVDKKKKLKIILDNWRWQLIYLTKSFSANETALNREVYGVYNTPTDATIDRIVLADSAWDNLYRLNSIEY